MEAIATVLALFMALMVVAGTVAAVRTVRTVRRGVERSAVQARRTVEETVLRARSLARPGPHGALAALRLSLRTSLVGTRQALQAGVDADPGLQEALRLLDRLRGHAHALDDELRLLEREPDRGRVAARLPELRRRTERVTGSADSLRWAALDRARRFSEEELAALGRDIEVEAGALRHWVPTTLRGPGRAGIPGA